jgi:hypothetical protein
MGKYDQRGQIVQTQYNAGGDINFTILEPAECYLCGRLCLPGEAYRCRRCRYIVCTIHRQDIDLSLCPACKKLVDMENQLSDPDDDVRLSAAQKLYTIKNQSTISVVKLHFQIEANPIVKYWLACALGSIGGEEARKELKSAITQESNDFVKQGVEEALQLIDSATSS